ncbi:EfeM/EfeO family lipoprotein [Amycolatopsis sp. H20-H5]|uniref:EfeM/EfeO family lipoprotein n=1 Tax=Amycolatopsis sp. H20-H5 TaxID=3046309 RepID=UPI002DBD8575|nr:EfeM/EfeO family lipoprotein [Amycolatopsis sp. H20-H5]MEC3981950.1 EfeM/EfeO family lipoprotein [Amycolatopsis sp. H20-H5]
MRKAVRLRWGGGVVAAVAVAGLVVALWPDTAIAGDPEIAVSRSDCGTGWAEPRPGQQTFLMHNTGSVTAEADLIDPVTGVVYGEVEGLGAGTTRPLQVTLGNGRYAFRCLPEETEAIVGPVATVTGGTAQASPGVTPVTAGELLGPLKTYHQHVTTGLDTLVRDTAALKAAVGTGDRAVSRTAWLTAHLSYERLGAAYNAFGDSDGALNGTTDGLPGGAADPGFTGFHRLEYGLWHDQDMAALTAVAAQIDTDARKLRDSFGGSQIDGNDLGLRAHEIMENALQFELTGRTDYGSGTTLATARANLDGTRAVLDVLRPVLTPRFPGLSTVDAWLGRTQTALDSAHRPDGGWTPVAQLDQKHRQALNGAIGELTEQLAPIAAIAQPRRT